MIVTIRPQPASIIEGSAALVQCMTPKRLTAKKRRQSAGFGVDEVDEDHESVEPGVAGVVDEDVDAAHP